MKIRIACAIAAVALLATAPQWASLGQLRDLVELLTLLALAQMWNLLAGYAGLVSIGQQAYVGIGAYAFFALGDKAHVQPYLAVFLAGLIAAVIAAPTGRILFRLHGGYFAIGTWVVAEMFHIIVLNTSWLGGGSGVSVLFASDIDRVTRQQVTYWLALGVGAGSVLLVWALLRSRVGLALMSIRDDEAGAESLGVDVTRSKLAVYVISALGCGLVGAVTYLSLLRIQPEAAFTVNWSAYMIFIVVIGGLGTVEGPIIGTVLFYLLRQQFSSQGVWYLVGLGVVAVAFSIWLRGGIWGFVQERTGLRLFPVGRKYPGDALGQVGAGARGGMSREPA